MNVSDVHLPELLRRAQPHDLSLGWVESWSAGTHPVVDMTDASSKAVYSCYSIADSDMDIDLTVVNILMQVHVVRCVAATLWPSSAVYRTYIKCPKTEPSGTPNNRQLTAAGNLLCVSRQERLDPLQDDSRQIKLSCNRCDRRS